jgi:hypothetical protein|tara:strand:+ start:573 stop:716 length:144 start_codon:yes stop_codon:yes gene_type:complete
MIKIILAALKIAKGETKNIQIAQGKNKLPTTFKEGWKQLKQEVKWRQ